MRFYVTKCLYDMVSRHKQAIVKDMGTKIQFPLQFSYRLEFETDTYNPQMTDDRISKQDILVFLINLYSYTDKLTLLWLTFCGAFLPFLLLIKIAVSVGQEYGILAFILITPILYILTDQLSSFIIVMGMRVIKKNITIYINQKQAGFQQMGVRWKVGEDEWLTLELVLDYKHSLETKKDRQEESGHLLKTQNAEYQKYLNDVEGSHSVLRQSFA